MILLSLLLALAVERVSSKAPRWHIDYWAEQYWAHRPAKTHSRFLVWGFLVLPALVLALILAILPGMLSFVIQTAVVFICIGCPALRQTYKCYLRAADANNAEACALYTQALGHEKQPAQSDNEVGHSFGQHLIWLNYQHYAAVILWFIAFGAPGALFYCLVRVASQQSRRPALYRNVSHLRFALDFLPARVTALGMLLVGHFSHAFPVWLAHLFSVTSSARVVILEVAAAAQTDTHSGMTLLDEPKAQVKLAKRNVLFLLIITALLTIAGAVA